MGIFIGAFVSKLAKDTSGATAIEYALIAAGIALVIITAVTAIGGSLALTFTNVDAGL